MYKYIMEQCNIGKTSLSEDIIKTVKYIKSLEENLRRGAYLNLLQTLKNTFKDYFSEEDFFNEVRKIINTSVSIKRTVVNDENLKELLSQDYNGELSAYDPVLVESTLDKNSKFDIIDSTEQELEYQKALKEHFLNPYFPMDSSARLAFELDFKFNLILRLFYNGTSEILSLNSSEKEIDLSIKRYREELLELVKNYIQSEYSSMKESLKTLLGEEQIALFENLINNGVFTISKIDLLRIPTLNTLTDEKYKNKLKTYLAYVALKHFDDLVSSSFEDAVIILYKGNYHTNELKYKINLGNRNANTWNDETKDIDETELIGSIIQLFMESLDLYSPSTEKKLPFKMSFQDVKAGLGSIQNVFNYSFDNPIRSNAISNGVYSILKNSMSLYYGENGWDYIWDEYFREKTFSQLLAKTKKYPALLLPATFAYISLNRDLIFKERLQEKLAVYSIFRNLFDPSNSGSLISRTIEATSGSSIDLDAMNLFLYVSTLFINIENILMTEYKRDSDGTINILELQQNTSNSRLNNLKYSWQGKFNISVPQQPKTYTIGEFLQTLPIRINNSDILIKCSANKSKGTVNIQLLFSNGKPFIIEDALPQELLNFLSEVFGKTIDSNYIETFESLEGNAADLLEIAGTILYNYSLGTHINKKIKETPSITAKETYEKVVKEIYGDNFPSPSRNSMQPELTNKSLYPKMIKLSKTFDILQGYSGDTVSKDGFGKQISLKGLPYLAARYLEIVENNNKGEGSILKNFTIYNIFEGVEFIRDYAGNDSKKQSTKFSSKEFLTGNFLYDFYLGQAMVSDTGIKSISKGESSDLKLRVLGPVVSDKPRIPRLKFSWNARVGDTNLLSMSADEVYNIQQKEFGDFYEGMYNRIHNDLIKLTPFILQIIPGAVLDYDNDYELFNLQCELAGMSPMNVLHNAIVKAQKDDPVNYDIRLTDNVHYIKAKGGKIHNNPALFHLLSIYGRPKNFKVITDKNYLPNLDTTTISETTEQARERLNLLFISELLQDDVSIFLGIKDSNVEDLAMFAAKAKNKDWIHGKNVIYARIFDGEENVRNLYKLSAFNNWNKYRDLKDFFGLDLPSEYDINSSSFLLGETLKAISVLHKYRAFTYGTSIKILSSLLDISKIDKEIELRTYYANNYPNWKSETIEKKVLEEITDEKLKEITLKNLIDTAIYLAIINNNDQFFVENSIILLNNLNEEDELFSNIMKSLNFSGYSLQINPEFERYLALNNWLSESFMLTSVGTYISHPGNNKASTIFNYEYGTFGQLVKRNVSFTATIHREALDSLKGIRSKLRIAIMEDSRNSAITYKGDYSSNEIKVHDGGTFYNGTMVDLDNSSLGADAMGLDKKPFIHYIDPLTGVGGIIKCAGFAVTNNHIQSSAAYARMNRKMNDSIKWTDVLKHYGYLEPFFNWLENFKGLKLHIRPLFVYKNGNWYKRDNFSIDTLGITSYDESLVYDNGEPYNVAVNQVSTGVINSTYDLWNLFGGAYSGHFNTDGKLSYINDNTSFRMCNYVMNNTGKIINPNLPAHSQANVRQIIKEAQIDIFATMGAVKNGPGNINSTQLLTDDEYAPTYIEIFSDYVGEQLNAEHTAEGGHVSLMTLVVNALGARGYSKLDAEECYSALELLAMLSFEDAFDGISKLNLEYPSTEDLKTEIANIVLNSIKNTPLSDGNILSAIATKLSGTQKFLAYKELEGVLPMSSPLISGNLFSKLASAIEKAAVRLKFTGGLLVLNPSDGIFKVVDGKLSGKVSIERYKELQALAEPIIRGSLIRMGRKYWIINTETNEKQLLLIDSVNDVYNLIYKLNEPNTIVVEAFYDNSTNTGIDRDLATYESTLTATDGTEYSMWELDVVHALHSWDGNRFRNAITPLEIYWNDYQSGISNYGGDSVKLLLLEELYKIGATEIDPTTLKLHLLREYQNTVNAIGSGIGNKVLIQGDFITIDKSKTQIFPYEAVLPMMYKTTFGLKESDEVGNISNDLFFFVKRFIDKSKSKFYSETDLGYEVNGRYFDLELKRISGDHVYLINSSQEKLMKRVGTKLTIATELVGEVLYRVDPNTQKRMYLIPLITDDQGIIRENCTIYKMRNGTEVIVTDDFTTFLDQFHYNSIAFGNLPKNEKRETGENGIFKINNDINKSIFKQLESSTNKLANAKLLHLLNSVRIKVRTNIEGIKLLNPRYKIIWDDEALVDLYSSINDDVLNLLTIDDLFDGAVFNALHYSDIYNIDATTQYLELQNLKDSINKFLRGKISNLNIESDYIQKIVNFGLELHTSFLSSLDGIVSRTPAQSLQSFMTMRCVGFHNNTTNSIFVSRMQLYLQGSDYTLK